MALAPRTVQNMPDCLRRWPITSLCMASIAPELTTDAVRETHSEAGRGQGWREGMRSSASVRAERVPKKALEP